MTTLKDKEETEVSTPAEEFTLRNPARSTGIERRNSA